VNVAIKSQHLGINTAFSLDSLITGNCHHPFTVTLVSILTTFYIILSDMKEKNAECHNQLVVNF